MSAARIYAQSYVAETFGPRAMSLLLFKQSKLQSQLISCKKSSDLERTSGVDIENSVMNQRGLCSKEKEVSNNLGGL